MSELKSFTCPSCGAALSITGREVQVKCNYCGTVSVVPAEYRTPATPPPVVAPQIVYVDPMLFNPRTATAYPIRSRSGVVGCIRFFSLLLLVGIIGIGAYAYKTGSLNQIIAGISNGALGANVVVSGTEGKGPGQFKYPIHMALDGKGNFYIADATFRVQRFGPDGQYQNYWTIQENDPDKKIDQIAADAAGNVYVVDAGTITKYDGTSGKLLIQLDSSAGAFYHMDLMPDGSIWAIAGGDNLVHLSPTGKILTQLTKLISSQTNEMGIAAWQLIPAVANDGTIYIFYTTLSHPHIYKFSSTGKLLGKFGDGGDEEGLFNFAQYMTLDNREHIYTIDQTRLQVFDLDGRYLKIILSSRSLQRISG